MPPGLGPYTVSEARSPGAKLIVAGANPVIESQLRFTLFCAVESDASLIVRSVCPPGFVTAMGARIDCTPPKPEPSQTVSLPPPPFSRSGQKVLGTVTWSFPAPHRTSSEVRATQEIVAEASPVT